MPRSVAIGRVSQTLLNDIKEGHVLIATEGKAVGKVNGLTVLDIADTAHLVRLHALRLLYLPAQVV